MQEIDRFVRDLIWAVNSPPLMDLTSGASAIAQPLKIGDVDREHLRIHFNAQPEQRVGRYFERLIAYWIRYIRRCEIVAHSLQLREGKQTVGELDLLFRDEHGRLNHWEVACKFYLQVDMHGAPATEYIGPNAEDTLQKKVTRLLEHQLPLGIRYFPEIEVRHAFVKGRIFYHWLTGAKDALPVELAADHLDGKWIRLQELPELLGDSGLRYRILRKPFWLAEELAAPSGDEGTLSPEEVWHVLENHFSRRNSPMLISAFRGGNSSLRECERWFVVPSQWPL